MAQSVNYTYVYFDVRDYSNTRTLSSYTLSNTPLKFIPALEGAELFKTDDLSNKKLFWDFGDGETSNEYSPTHQYRWPGNYSVKLTVYGKNGNAYDSSYSPTVQIYDFIYDQLLFEDYKNFIYDVPASKIIDPLIIKRQNSWQSYNALSATGYTLFLYASGAYGEYLDVNIAQNDKWSHLRALSRFYQIQQIGDIKELVTVDRVTTSNTEIYARVSNNKLEICNKDDEGSVFCGTTGAASFYYVDDVAKNYTSRDAPIFIFASFDNSKFNDKYTLYNNSYEYIPYTEFGFQNLKPAVMPIIKVRHNPAEALSITSNGIDGEGTLSATNFNMPEISWQNTEIPFVIRMKDNEKYTTKTYPPLSSASVVTYVQPPTSYNLNIGLVKQQGSSISPVTGVKFFEDFNDEIPQSIGAFFKGYFIVNEPTTNCILTASMVIEDPISFPKDTLVGWIAVPQFNLLLRFFRQQIYSFCPGFLTLSISASSKYFDARQNRNVYSIQVSPSGSGRGDEYTTWFADGTNDTLIKFDVNGALLSSFSLSSYPLLTNTGIVSANLLSPDLESAAPGSMAMDGNGDVWIALFDSVSAIKIDSIDGYIKAVAYPNVSNIVYALSSDYNIPSLSGFAGENILLPSSVETDIQNNVWVSYTHPISNFVVKYDPYGALLKVIPFPTLISPVEICVDRNKFVWITAYNLSKTNVKTLTGRDDYLYKFDSNGNLIPGYPKTGFRLIGNITIDGKQNAWVVQNRDTLTKIDGYTGAMTNFIGGSGNFTNYIGSIGGIACDSSDFIWVINNFNNKMYFIDTTLPSVTGANLLPNVDLSFPNITINELSTFEEKLFQAYGDWLGGRWVNKYVNANTIIRTISGESTPFTIYPTSGQYNVSKINEDFNAQEFFKSLIFTESLEDKNRFFDDFLGTIVGSASAQPYELGKTIYEKIANYVNNNSDVDKCNIDQLIAICNELSIQFEQYNYLFPPQLSRLINILSIKHKNLWGETNKFAEAFNNSLGTITSPVNVGTELSTLTSTISSGIPVIAYEVFSDNYKLVNTNLIYENNISLPYKTAIPLSGYSYDWGWGLIAPKQLSGSEISDYYKFYNYIYTPDNTILNNIIDWNNRLTTLQFNNSSFTDWSNDNGIMQNMISYELTKGLRLFLSGSNIVYNN